MLVYVSNIIHAQSPKIDDHKRKLFYEQFTKQQINSNESCTSGKLMLQYAQDDYEKALANNILGECTYNAGDFLKSVQYLRQAEGFATKTDSLREKLRILNMLIIAYRRAGFIVESDENWTKMQTLVKKTPNIISKEDLLYIQAKIHDIDKDYCKSADVRKKYLDLVTRAESDDELNNRYRFAVMSQLCYVQIKCGRINDAKQSYAETNKLLSKIKIKEPIQLIEFYFMNKALIELKDKNNIDAKKSFDSAYYYVMLAKTNSVIKLILTERIDSNIDSAPEQLKFSKIVSKISDSETTVTKKLALKESLKNKKIISEKEQKLKIYTAFIITAIISLVGFILYYFKNKKQEEIKYKKIISDLQSSISEPSKVNQIIPNHNSSIVMSLETEQVLLKNLESFENKKLFTTKGISIAQMAVMVKTNTKYLSHILKKHRESDFNDYINTYRINFIIKELHDKPQLLQYKISAISEMCGYQTHSQFGTIFKNKKGISPSTYINFLLEDKKNK